MVRAKIIGAGSIGNHLGHACRRLGWGVTLCDVDPAALCRAEHMSATVDELVSGGFDSVWMVSPTDSKSYPRKQLVLDVTRQQLTPVYHRDGAAYAITRECLLEQKTTLGRRSSAIVIEEPMFSIDTLGDCARAEAQFAVRERGD